MSKTPEYRAWVAMRQRCYNQKYRKWGDYGGRGIVVCKEWLESFNSFYLHVGDRPTSRHSLDRIDNSGNYEPGNVRWATWDQQANNRRPRKPDYKGNNIFPGVYVQKKWYRVSIRHENKTINVASYLEPEEAVSCSLMVHDYYNKDILNFKMAGASK